MSLTGGGLIGVILEPEDVSLLERCPHFRGCYAQALMELGPENVSLLERWPHFTSMELGPEEMTLLERCPHFSVMYTSMKLGPKDVYLFQWSWER